MVTVSEWPCYLVCFWGGVVALIYSLLCHGLQEVNELISVQHSSSAVFQVLFGLWI